MVGDIRAETTPGARLPPQGQFDDLVLQAVLETSLDAVIVIRGTGTIIGWNTTAAETFGWTAEEALGRQLRDLIIPEQHREDHDKGLRRYLKTGEAQVLGTRIEITALDRNGREFPVELSILRGLQMGSDIFVGFLRDLSEKQAAEAKIEALQIELVHVSRVAAMGAMAAVLAHELNQPLTAAVNYLSAGQRILETVHSPLATEANFALTRSQDALQRMGATIRDVRDTITKRPLKRERCDLDRLVRDALRMLGPSLALTPEVHIDRQARWIDVNRIQIEHVLLGLIKNACEAMAQTERRELKIDAKAVGSAMVELRVRDSGGGLDPAIGDKLFSPIVSAKSDGLGLGLSIYRSVIEEHQGNIWTEAHPDGTSFCFTVPMGSGE